MAGRIPNEQRKWNDQIQQGLEPLLGPNLAKGMASVFGSAIYQATQQQAGGQSISGNSSTLGTGTGTRGASPAQKRAAKAGGKARGRKPNTIASNMNGTAGETSAHT